MENTKIAAANLHISTICSSTSTQGRCSSYAHMGFEGFSTSKRFMV